MLARRSFIGGMTASIAALAASPLAASPLAKVKELGVLRVAVYKDNRPWSWNDTSDGSAGTLRGIDVDLARSVADTLGVRLDIVELMAGDDLAADLRNAVWRGGLLGFRPCDMMMHVPFDRQLMIQNDQVAILSPYYRESFAAACGPEIADCEAQVPQWRGHRMAAAIGSVPDNYLLGGFGGIFRSSVTHFNTGYDAVLALGTGQTEAAIATRAEVEAGLHDMKNPTLHARRHALEAMTSPGWDIAVAVKENSRSLGDAVEGIMAAMATDGRMAKLFAAHGVEWRPAISG